MSGITKYTKQSQLFLSLIALVINYSFLIADDRAGEEVIEKKVKVKSSQSRKGDSKQATAAAVNKQSIMMIERSSSYKDISDPGLMLEKRTSEKSPKVVKKQTQLRDENLPNQLKSSEFFFSSAYATMDFDADGDGYYSEFTVNFDADTNYNHATVYAQLYLSFEGGPWELYYSTNNFQLDDWSSYDDYSVSTILTSGFPPGSYDILVDLYDEYDNTLVATISAYDTYDLAEYYLEDISYEDSSATSSIFSIFDASIVLLNDNDNDGFYQSFSLQFDADVKSGQALVYGEIWVMDSSGNWLMDHATDNFIIEGYSTLDTYILETVWESGYNTGYYDFRIEIYDAYSNLLLTTSEAQSFQLSDVPLEAATADVVVSTGGGNVGGGSSSSVSHGSGGGGSMGVLVLALGLLSLFRGRLNPSQIISLHD